MGPWTQFNQPQKAARDAEVGEKENNKLEKVRRRGYVRSEEVRSLTNYLSAPKEEDIRMV